MSTDRARGALLGLAVGDALGTTYEFDRLEQPAYPALAAGPATDVVGGGPFDLAPGCVTDDTQMAVCLARALAADFDAARVARGYVAWAEHAFDVGNQTAAALHRIAQGREPHDAGISVWHDSGRHAAGNGSLMRTTPIAIAYGERDQLVAVALADSLITHADPRCALACATFDATIAFVIRHGGEHVIGAARKALAVAASELAGPWRDRPEDLAAVRAAEADLGRDLDAAEAAEPGVHGAELDLYRTAGFVRVAFRLAFWHAVHTRSWQDALVDVASRGGDSDTNAAIAGALLGARDGASAIPAAWIERVLAATLPGPPDWAAAHHPRHLLALV